MAPIIRSEQIILNRGSLNVVPGHSSEVQCGVNGYPPEPGDDLAGFRRCLAVLCGFNDLLKNLEKYVF
jgi:hypothetical protein